MLKKVTGLLDLSHLAPSCSNLMSSRSTSHKFSHKYVIYLFVIAMLFTMGGWPHQVKNYSRIAYPSNPFVNRTNYTTFQIQCMFINISCSFTATDTTILLVKLSIETKLGFFPEVSQICLTSILLSLEYYVHRTKSFLQFAVSDHNCV